MPTIRLEMGTQTNGRRTLIVGGYLTNTNSSRRRFLRQSSGALLALGGRLSPAEGASSTLQVFYDPAVLEHEQIERQGRW